MIIERLPNGVQVVVKESHATQAAAVQCWVGVGSLDEAATEHGMAHFVEHMLFKGTKKYGVGEIAATVEAHGGDINAYTTFDHTVYHVTMPTTAAVVGVGLLADALADSQFDPAEIEREREVILEEIRRGEDSPGAKVGRKVFELAFAGTPAARPIIGAAADVAAHQRDAVHAFYRRWYVAGNLTVVAIGAFEESAMLAEITAHFGRLPQVAAPARAARSYQAAPAGSDPKAFTPKVAVIRGDYQQPRLELVWGAPSMDHHDGPALDAVAFALGTGELGRLSRRLRERDSVVTSISASVYAPAFGGIFEVSALMPVEQMTAALTAMTKETLAVMGGESVTDAELDRARANLKLDRLYRDETVDGQARSVGYGLRTQQGVTHDDVYTAMIDALTPRDVTTSARRWLGGTAPVIVALVPLAATVTEAQLVDAYRDGLKALVSGATKRVATHASLDGHVEVTQLAPGLRVVYRQDPGRRLFTLTAASEGGLRAESAKDTGAYHAVSGLLGLATKRTPHDTMMARVEGQGADLEGFSGKDSFGMHVQGLPEQAAELMELLAESLSEPVFITEKWLAMRAETLQHIAAQNDQPGSICVRRFQELVFGDHPYRYPLYGTQAALQDRDERTLLAHFEKTRDGGPWVLAAMGPEPWARVKPLFDQVAAHLRPSTAKRVFPSAKLAPHVLKATSDRVNKDREQTHLVYGFKGLNWADTDRPALDVLVHVLGGHGGRLFRELRDKDSLAYTVSPLVAYGVDPGVVGAYIACAPKKEEAALKALKREIHGLADLAPEEDEVDRARRYIIGTHDLGLQHSDAQVSTMALMELYGIGYDDFLRYPESVSRVTTADVLRVAQRLFDPQAAIQVSVGPG